MKGAGAKTFSKQSNVN